MMNLTELLKNLSAKNVELWVDGDKLYYEAPENALTPELLGEIKQYKLEIIKFLSQAHDPAPTYSLSYGQKALWFLYQLAPQSVAYHLTYTAKLVRNLDIVALKQAAQVLLDRHPVLRTTFATIDGEPMQTVHENQQVDFSIEEVFDFGQDDIDNWLSERSDRLFNLEQGPIVRFDLLINQTKADKLATKEYILLITLHHIVGDFWSLEIIVRELRALYQAISNSVSDQLPTHNYQYQDYVKWSEQMLASSEGERLWNYWQQQLSGELPLLNLLTDRPRPESQTYNGACHFFALEEKLLQKLTELATKEGSSLYTVILTALQILLLRYTNQEDILIGSPMVNRSRSEFEKIVGYFTNPVVLRGDLSGNPTFEELLLRSRSCVLNALDHQEYPFPLLVERLQPVRDPSRSPLYQVALAWDRSHQSNQEVSLTESDGLIVESIPGSRGAVFDLTLTILDLPGALKGTWNYNTDLFDSSTIERMVGHFITLLEAIVANPQARISLLPILTDQEQQQLLVEWNNTQVDYALDKCIHQLFEEQVERTPDAVAVVFENQQLTYDELNSRANQLAHYLQSMGVSADVLVGLSVERSLLMLIGLLGILKAGGAYVPLDPEYPTERLSFMLEDAEIQVLLTQQPLVASLPKHQGCVVCLDTHWNKIAQESESNPLKGATPSHPAYVIYTSGSTGQPKGVLVNHYNVVRLFAATSSWYNFNAEDVWTLFHSYAFDFSVWEMWGALLYGGQLVVVPYLVTRSPESFYELLCQKKVTILNQTPSAFRQLIQAENFRATIGDLKLRLVIFGGEALEMKSLQPWFERHGDESPQLVNMYGITETTVHVTYRPLTQGDVNGTASVIGRPIPDLQVYVLDQHLQPVPIGVPGEMYVGGGGVTRGYLHRDELTTQRFISDSKFKLPYRYAKNTENAKLYKTGDLARYLPNGELEYLGRIDQQVKIRGFRIELGEIEAVVSQYENVETSVVIAREDTPGDKRLVAYIVLHPEVRPTVLTLRNFLKKKLPEYMVPQAFVFLEALPLTPNGKVDRRALPTPDIHSQLQDQYVSPRTPTEEILAQIWAQVLKVELVGRHDNFFTLGGHSLLATQVVSRIRNIFNVELPLRSLFATATVAELAQSIQQLQPENTELTFSPILPRKELAELPLSFAQQRLWFLEQWESNSGLYNIPMALRLVGNLNVAALEQSLEEIIARHEALRTNLITVEGQAVQIIQGVGNWTLSVVDLQHLSTLVLSEVEVQVSEVEVTEKERAALQLVQQKAIEPFDLSNEPLVRGTLVVLSGTEHILNVCMHHVVSDGWSIGVFLEELQALYNAYAQGQPSPLVPLAIQYADFAIWQREWLVGDVLQKQLSYWLQQLADAPTLLSLPTDRPRPAVQSFSGGHIEFALSMELTQGLTKLSQEQGCTLFMTLLVCFNILLYRYTGESDILVGTPIANRHRSEIEGLIGFFVNTLVMRTDLSGEPRFSELLTRVRAMAMSAYAHQDLPFEMLVEALQPERDLSHTPLFQVMFVLQNASMSELELTGLTVSSLPIETELSKFDLTLSMGNTNTGLAGAWEYNSDLFDRSTIERMVGHFVTLLEAIVANPEERISLLPILTAPERQQLLVEWNETQVDYAFDQCIHQLFEEQVARTPDAIAVVFENQQLTYQQLNSRANQLAHYLQSMGVRADVLVGLCVQRSVSMVVGILGILKAGGAYVPLDPEYPTERLSFMLEDAGISVLLTQNVLQDKLSLINWESRAKVICLEQATFGTESIENLSLTSTPRDLAYVIYTSGSTGLPKGVMIEHLALVNLSLAWAKTFGVQPQSRLLQFGSFSFDLSVAEIATTLVTGASLYLANKETLLPSQILVDFLSAHQITHSFVSPSALSVLPKASLSHLECLGVGGEACPAELVTQWGQGRGFYNCYGPTESTVNAAIARCQPNGKKPPIGSPLPNIRIYILDPHNQLLPPGIPGELCIAGAGLARGYLNRPDLTTEKFIYVELGGKTERIYKTGDLARWLADGSLEYLGRIDNQVKIRGFRIELGEIEAVLSQYPDVQVSVVIVREDTPGDKRLVAYIVSHPEVTLTVSELRSFLKSKLPDYMVPSAIVILESLPLTPNGKIDKRALPEPESRTGIEVRLVAPRTRVEAKLVEIWAQVLRVAEVGIHDNFFSLGGDSILSIQIITRAKLAGIELTVKQLFANQTIAELATVALTTTAVTIEQGLVTGTLPLTPVQHQFFQQDLPQKHHFNQSFLLKVPSNIKPEILEQVWQELLKHHDALRLRFSQTNGTWQQIHAETTDSIAISIFDLSTLPESEQKTTIETTANQLQGSLNLSENLVRVALFNLGVDKQARLLIVIHHLVVDGVSWRILLEDLQTGYEQLSQGKAIELPAKTTSFKDWSQQLTNYAVTDILKSELADWLRADYASIAPIPVDFPAGVNTVASTQTISVSLNEAQTHSLLQDVPKAYKTQINDVLLTALVLVVSRWTNSKSVLFNLEGHGREEIVEGVDLSRTIGWFTTIFPVLVELEVTDNLAQALKSVKEQLRAIPNKGIGYGLLRYLSVDAEIVAQLETIPDAEISFNYLGQFSQVLNPDSLMQVASENSGQVHSLEGQRPNLLDINAIITNERLEIHWAYSSNVHQHETIEKIAQEFVAKLQDIIAHCLSPESGGYTPTDFPLIKLNQQELDGVLATLASKTQLQSGWQNIEEIYPLSPMQAGMLFESLYAPETGVYFEQTTGTFTGNLDVKAFQQAWEEVVARHSIFRTAFLWESLNQPLQVVYRQVEVKVETIDWQELPAFEQLEQLETFLASLRQQGLEFSIAPLMRLYLLRMSENTYQFVWCFHHILLDGWSSPLVWKDLLSCYQAIAQGESLALQPPVSYRNYIAWLQQQDQQLALEFWRRKLQGFSAPTPLTVDQPLSNRKEDSSYSDQEIHLTVSATKAVRSFARQHQLTINNLVQATWGLLLSRYSGEPDVVFGATVSGRPPGLMGVESMVGLFINTVPVRVQISENTELLGLLKDLQAQQVESEQFSYSSLVEIQGVSDVPRGTSLFESIVVFENYPVDTAVVQDGSLELSNFRAIEQTNYPLTVVAFLGEHEQLFLKVSYDTSQFDHGTISRMLGHFVTLLEAIVANPEERISLLPILTAPERQQLLVEWNDTQVDYAFDKCIHQLFEEQVARTPDAVAVVFENQQLTYRELNSHANQLAHYLQSMGVSADALVGICVERSLLMVVGLLGILKAGGAYVPLDPEYPQERLNFMLQDAQVSVLVTQESLQKQLRESQAQRVCLDQLWGEIRLNHQDNPTHAVTSGNLANVIYTSGSTGKPKGVMVEHRGLYNLAISQQKAFGVDCHSRVLQFASVSFDACIWEVLMAFGSGATLCLGTKDSLMPGMPLIEGLRNYGITHVTLPPSALAVLPREKLPALSTLIVAGEACGVELMRQWSAETNFFNAYGPTEASVCTTIAKCTPMDEKIFIGRPIANTQVYILDEYLQPVPVGVPGELHIGGAGLARGYLNRPELTRLKFIPNPFDNSKLYKTGDLARYLPDGKIEYLGRIDNQVKIRGFRIELGEIEAVLSQQENVQTCCVIAREDIPGNKRLVAYIVAHPEVTPTVLTLRNFLKEKLPDYMVPSAIVILESLPLTPNGKIDKRALSAPLNPSASDAFVPPRNTVELQLVQIWSKILKVHNVGVKDNFFDLGGHSLLAPYLIAQIKQQFGKDIPLAHLFQHPTIEELASVVQTETDADSWSPLVPIQPMGSNPPLFCLPGAGGFPFYLYNLASSLGSEQPFYSFQAHNADGELAVISRVEDIATQYLEAIQAVQPQGPYFLGGHSFGGKVAFEIAQQLLRQGEVVALVAILDTTAPIAQAKPEEWNDTTSLIETVKFFQTAFAKDLEMDASPLFCLAPEEQFKYVLDYFKMVDLLPPDADTTYLKRLLQAFKADGNAFAEYEPQQVNPIAITLFRASERSQQESAALQQSELLQDLAWGWNAFSSEPVDVHFVPGTHVTMMTQPHVQVLAQRLSVCIKQAMHI